MVIRRLFYLILGLTYIVAGIYIFMQKILPAPWGTVLLITFLLYGSWRMYRAFKLK